MSPQSRSPEDTYINAPSRDDRIAFLLDCVKRKISLKFELVRDMLYLPLSTDEKALLIKVCNGADTVAMEDFLFEIFENETQDLATPAVYEAVERTPATLAYRFTASCLRTQKPQRVIYTILNFAQHFGGKHAVLAISMSPGIEEMSAAFHSLLFQQALLFNVHSKVIDNIAESYLEKIRDPQIVEDRVLINLIPYLAAHNQKNLEIFLNKNKLSPNWLAFAHATIRDYNLPEKSYYLEMGKAIKKSSDLLQIQLKWPHPWNRASLTKDDLNALFSMNLKDDLWSQKQLNEMMIGVPERELISSLKEQNNVQKVFTLINTFSELLCKPVSAELMTEIENHVTSAENPGELMGILPTVIKENIKLGNSSHNLENISKERQQVFKAIEAENLSSLENMKFHKIASAHEPQNDRETFFQIAFNKKVGYKPSGKDFWTKLATVWLQPDIKLLGPLAEEARKNSSILQLSYLTTLSRFKGKDEAALKILDFIRSENDDELRAIIYSLSEIASERALQELVLLITKPNMNPSLQLEACEILKDRDLTSVQKEIRRAISDLTIDIDSDDIRHEVRDNLKLLLVTEEPENIENLKTPNPGGPVGTKNLDISLRKKIPNYERISSEVKSALRTAEFFHSSILQAGNVDTIDFSPLIDMQYKALELIFREMFEGPVDKLIKQGILQRKLDIIGYARPIPPKMDQFEEFIGDLNIINTVPFFSKFKLRKTLRALCQYRPGRRFTLDGLKAFGLFFLCFSRKECKFGLQSLFPLPYKSDEELFEFVKTLHIFQDFRNRAAHEGFPPAARNNIDGIWLSTSEILQNVFLIRDFIESIDKNRVSKDRVA